MKKKIAIGLLVVLILMQFFRPEKNISTGISPNDITTKYKLPPEIAGILQKSCYDCHSNNTVYPWYSHIQPLGWWLADHIKEGKKHLNFSEFATYKAKRADHKMEEIIEQLEGRLMPLGSYTSMHSDAKLNEGQRGLLINWAKGMRKSIADTLQTVALR